MTEPTDHEIDLNPDGGLTTLVDLRLPIQRHDTSVTGMPAVARDQNDLRLERMLRREHLVYGIPTPFVGRRQPLEALYNAVRGTVNDQRLTTVGVVGGAGSGKTRLLAEMFAIIDPLRRGIQVLTASCSDSESREGAGVIAQLVRRRFKIRAGDTDEDSEAKIVAGLEAIVQPRLLTTATRLMSYLAGLPGAAITTAEEQWLDPRRFHRRAVKTLANLMRYDAGKAPQVIIFHRVQHLTDRAGAVLAELTEALRDRPITIVYVGDRPTPERQRASGNHVEIALPALARGDAERLLRALLCKVDALPDELVEDVLDRSAGLPGLVEDNVRLLIERGVVVRSEPKWTVDRSKIGQLLADSVEGASQARVEGLSPKLREVLAMASVFGPAFWQAGLLALMRTRPYDGSRPQVPWVSDRLEQRLNKLLLEAKRADLVVFHTDSALEGQVEFGFVNRQTRQRLYQQLPEARRALYHRMVAQWLAGLSLADPGPWVEVIGNHLELGERPERAAEYYRDAGRVARGAHDLAKAREFFRRGLSLVDVDRARVLVELLEELGDAVIAGGDFAEARRVYGALLEASLVTTDRAAGARAWRKLGRAHQGLGDYQRARPCFEHSLALARRMDAPGVVADALDAIAKLLWMQGEAGGYDEALAHFEKALELRRVGGEPRALAQSLVHIGNIALQRGETIRAETMFQEALDLRRRVGDREGEAHSHVGLGAVRHAVGDFDGAANLWSRGLDVAEAVGNRELIGVLLNNLGEALVELGDVEEAERCLTEAREVTDETGDVRTGADVLRNLANVSIARGLWEDALDLVDEAVEACEAIAARPTLAAALRSKGIILGQQLFADDTEPNAEAREAIECFERSVSVFDEVGDAVELERSLRAFARHLSERGASQRAGELRRRADEIAAKLRAARDELSSGQTEAPRRSPRRSTRPRQKVAAPPAPTPAEAEPTAPPPERDESGDDDEPIVRVREVAAPREPIRVQSGSTKKKDGAGAPGPKRQPHEATKPVKAMVDEPVLPPRPPPTARPPGPRPARPPGPPPARPPGPPPASARPSPAPAVAPPGPPPDARPKRPDPAVRETTRLQRRPASAQETPTVRDMDAPEPPKPPPLPDRRASEPEPARPPKLPPDA